MSAPKQVPTLSQHQKISDTGLNSSILNFIEIYPVEELTKTEDE